MNTPLLHVVHCIDTEGPLEEPLDATFDRLRLKFGLELPPNLETLRGIQEQKIDLGGREAEIADFVAPRRLAYLSTWQAVEEMVRRVTSSEFRMKLADPQGNPYTYSWFLIDVVGYADNPRRKPVGFNVVFDHYQRMLKDRWFNDSYGWHFHTVPVGNHALSYSACWTNNDFHEQALARRLIERGSFPSIYRAGGTIERIDLSFWLEQFIPFDYSCASRENDSTVPGNQWDWRGAPVSWRPYHPDFYDVRRPGSMNRSLFRCLDIDTNVYALNANDVALAMETVQQGKSAVLAYACHDRRDMRPEIEQAAALVKQVAADFPGVRWKWSNAHEAARDVCELPHLPAPKLSLRRSENTIHMESDQRLFGPHPFLAVEEAGGVFYRDNPTIEGPSSWAYHLERPATTLRIGVAGANAGGEVGVAVFSLG